MGVISLYLKEVSPESFMARADRYGA